MRERKALLLGSACYSDSELPDLKTPKVNIHDLGALLKSNKIGCFTKVDILGDPLLLRAQEAIAGLFATASPDDLLLLYFSGHGIKDDHGRIYFAVGDTRKKWPGPSFTAISDSFLRSMISESLARRVVIILDCCFSGAFSPGALSGAAESVPIKESLDNLGSGRTILTSTDETRLAWEEDENLPQAEHSVFSHFLIEGLQSGSADRNKDGLITVDELFDFAREKVSRTVPRQNPQKYNYKNTQDIVIARNPFLTTLDEGLRNALANVDPYVRKAALLRLEEILKFKSSKEAISIAALDALHRATNDTNPLVSQEATKILDSAAKKTQSATGARSNDHEPSKPQATDSPQTTKSQDETYAGSIWAKLQSGVDYDFALLWLAQAQGLREGEALRYLAADVRAVALEYGATLYLQEANGDLFLFYGEGRVDRAVLAGLKILEKVDLFLATHDLSLGRGLQIAIDAATLPLREAPIGILADYPLTRLQSPEVPPADYGLSASKEACSLLSADARLLLDDHRKREPRRYITIGDDLDGKADPQELIERFENSIRDIRSIFERYRVSKSELEKARSLSDKLYETGHLLIDSTFHTDTQLGDSGEITTLRDLLTDEGDLRDSFLTWLELQMESESDLDLEAVQSFFLSKNRRFRSRAKARISEILRLEQERRSPTSTEDTVSLLVGEVPAPSHLNIENLIHELLESDDLERDRLVDDLIVNKREQLTSFLEGPSVERLTRENLALFWHYADQILIEDLAQLQSGSESKKPIVRCLAGCLDGNNKFACLLDALRRKAFLGTEELRTIFASRGVEYSPTDWIILQRSCTVASDDFNTKSLACSKIPLSYIWGIAVNPKVSALTTLVLLNRVYKESEEGDDLCKMFFDCTRSRLLSLAKSPQETEIDTVNSIIYRLFDLDFFVEDVYFDRLDEILTAHRATCEKANKQLDHFSSYIESLEQRKADLGFPSAKLPKEIDRIPKGVQRRLAREGIYLDYFVLHPDSRIALETLPHIQLSNVGKILQYRGINMPLLFEISKRRQFFRTRKNAETLLHHPKCPKDFARMFIKTFSFTELSKVAMDPNANRNIRDLSRITAMRLPSCNLRFARDNLARLPEYEALRLSRDHSVRADVRKLAQEHVQRRRQRGVGR